jgi:hypothetical protein
MVRTLILNQSNIVPNTGNSVFRYNFPQGGVYLEDETIAVQQVSLFNSVFNISSDLDNNTFSYIWVDGTINVVTMPAAGAYFSLADINAYLQSVMIANKHYLTTSGTNPQNVFFIELVVNQSRYADQLNCFPMNTTIATAAGWVVPTGTLTWAIPTGAQIVPMLVVPDTNFGDLIGFDAGKYPDTIISGTAPASVQTPVVSPTPYSVLSSFAPQIQPQPSFLGLCSLVNNKLVIPNQTIFSMTPVGVGFGSLFTLQVASLAYNKVENGNYSGFEFRFVDSLGNDIDFQDPNILIILVMKNKNDKN